MAAQYKRRVYFIEPSFQLRFITKTFLFILVGSLIAAGSVFYTGWTEFGEKLAAVYPQGHLVKIFYKVNLQVLINLFLALPILLYISMRISHRIAGPVYRIKKELAEIGQGRLDKQVKLRDRDELKDIATSINQMLTGLKAISETKRKELEKVEQELANLQTKCGNGGYDLNWVKEQLAHALSKIHKIEGEL